MSIVEQMPEASSLVSGGEPAHGWSGWLFFGFGELVRLNLQTCSSALAAAQQHWTSVVSARTPEQLIRAQAAILPSFAEQISTYSQGWCEILSGATASRPAPHHDDGYALQLRVLLDDMAWSAKGVDALLRAMNPATMTPDSVGKAPAAPRNPTTPDPDRARTRAAQTRSTASKRRNPSSGRS